MREIKFRAWDKVREIMSPVREIRFGDDGSALTILFETAPKDIYDDPRTHGESGFLMAYTGLKDKNGKEIYEGDIVRWTYTNSGKEMIAEVKWKGVGFKPTRLSDRNTFEMKIIGNIYENPELLK